MKPDASNHNPCPLYLRGLIEKSGISQRKTAQLVGMSWTGFRNYLRAESEPLYRVAPYTVQFALEALARPKCTSYWASRLTDVELGE
ncbi:MAG: hypothetical protein ACRCUH_10200 [Shewanella sp.]